MIERRRRYAEGTEVSVDKSRGEINAMLRRWKCDRIAWADSYIPEHPGAVLQFVWRFGENDYAARFSIRYPTDAELAKLARHKGRSYSAPLPSKLEKLRAARGKMEHRQLCLWLKATFNAVEAGIIKPETVFLPWLVGQGGQTVGEAIVPRLPALLTGSASSLLMLGDGR